MFDHDVNADFGERTSARKSTGIARQRKVCWTHEGLRHGIAPHGHWRKYCPLTLKKDPSTKRFKTIESFFASLGDLSDV